MCVSFCGKEVSVAVGNRGVNEAYSRGSGEVIQRQRVREGKTGWPRDGSG